MRGRLVLLTDVEARAELDKLGASFRDDAFDGLDALGLLPRVSRDAVTGIPCVALPVVLAATRARSADTIDHARAGLSSIVEFFDGAQSGARDEAIAMLHAWLDAHAVLGDLADLLPMLAPSTLESLRGIARAEWRVREGLAWLDRMVDAPALGVELSPDRLTASRTRLSTVPSLPAVRSGDDGGAEPAERWVAASTVERREICIEVARAGALDAWVDALDEAAPGEVVSLLSGYATAALDLDAGAGDALRVLALAYSRAEAGERPDLGRRRVRVARDAGHAEAELDAIDDLLPLTDSLERIALITRQAELLENELGRPDDATDRLVAAISGGTFDDDLVQRASRLLEARRAWSVLLGVLRTAARGAYRRERKGLLYRRIATLALHHLDDVDEAIALVREGMEATRGDARLASQLVDLAAAASDREAERAGLEALLAAQPDRPEARRVDRLITVLLDLEDTDAAVDLIERLLARPERDPALDTVLDRRLPSVADASGDVMARTRWLRRRAERETAPLQALGLWQQVVENEELLGVDPVERLASIERALASAEASDVDPGDVAELHMAAASLRLELGEAGAAGSHLARLGRSALRVSGAHERIGSLVHLLGTAEPVDDVAWDALHGLVLSTNDPDLLAEWADLTADAGRLTAATESLERAIDALAGDESRSAAVIRDLARLYERMNAPVDP